ncbi:PucR family transcriptional regulator ligand-binding domain-containing protein [Streptomyces sp. NPDC054796]
MHDPVPPTVPVPLSVLAEDAALGLRQIAGPHSPGTPVHAVHTSEMADPRPYLFGGELLLSAGVHCTATTGDDADAHWDDFAAHAVEARAAALGFGIAPVHDTVPPALADACDRLGLPLFEVPRATPFTAVARAVWQAMADLRHHALRRLSEAQRTLAAAAARQHPVPAVLRQLAQHLDGWAALFGPEGAELASAGAPPGEAARAELASLTALLRPGPSSAAGAHGGLRLSVYGLGGRGRLALGVCAPHRDGTDDAVAGVAVVLLSLLTEPRAAATDARRSAALVRLLLGAPAREAAALLGDGGDDGDGDGDGDGEWTVVRGRARAGGAGGAGRAAGGEAPGDDPFALSALAAGLGTNLIDVTGGELRALVPPSPGGPAPVEPQPHWTLGVSAPVTADELARGDAEAARALRRALAQRSALVRQGTEVPDGAGVASLVPPEERAAYARARLAPLEGSPALVETLRMWLSLHGSWDRTAVALSVHRNTVRQRIARAGELLGTDLGEADARMELWFALTWR